MSAVFEQKPYTGPEPGFSKFSIPLRWGLILGVVSCIFTTVNYMFLINNYILFLVATGLMFVLSIIFWVIAGKQQRKALGGYITIKDAFSAIFIVVLISSLISGIYGIIYAKFIDPDIGVKVKEGTLAFMERMNTPQAEIDKQSAEIDRQLEDSFSIKGMLLGYAKGLVFSAIIAMIIALIIKKNPPQQPQF